MYHIAVLTKSETQETFYREQLSRFCAERGLFPRVDCYRGQEVFFEVARKNAPTNAVISLPGVDGLNAVEHLRALFPETRIIWCSELDFCLADRISCRPGYQPDDFRPDRCGRHRLSDMG